MAPWSEKVPGLLLTPCPAAPVEQNGAGCEITSGEWWGSCQLLLAGNSKLAFSKRC